MDEHRLHFPHHDVGCHWVELGNRRRRPTVLIRISDCRNLSIPLRHSPGDGRNGGRSLTVDGAASAMASAISDMGYMKGIHVDVPARTVRAQGGVLWTELNRETQLHGLATTGGVVGSTGIAGLTLGGGIGWLMPKYGLALDNLRAADLVVADGRVLRVSADDKAELF